MEKVTLTILYHVAVITALLAVTGGILWLALPLIVHVLALLGLGGIVFAYIQYAKTDKPSDHEQP